MVKKSPPAAPAPTPLANDLAETATGSHPSPVATAPKNGKVVKKSPPTAPAPAPAANLAAEATDSLPSDYPSLTPSDAPSFLPSDVPSALPSLSAPVSGSTTPMLRKKVSDGSSSITNMVKDLINKLFH